MQSITNCLWFDTQAEDAAIFYTAIFTDSKIGKIARYGKEGFEFHQKPEGSVVTQMLNNVDGLKINLVFLGRLFQINCRN